MLRNAAGERGVQNEGVKGHLFPDRGDSKIPWGNINNCVTKKEERIE